MLPIIFEETLENGKPERTAMKENFYFGFKGFAAARNRFRSTHRVVKFKIFPKAGISNPHEKMPVAGS